MAKAVIQANIQSANGSVIVAPNASIYITDAGSGLPVTLWEERAGTTTTANPTTADTNGFFRVYANPGRVNIEATYGGNVQTFMDVPILEEGTGSPDGIVTIDFASDADLTLSSTQAANRFIILTDAGVVLTTARNVIFPTDAREWVVINNTAQTLTAKTSAGTGIAITASNAMRVYGDETNIEKALIGDGDFNALTATTLTATTLTATTLTATTPCLPDGYISGLIGSQAADTDHDITISTGAARDTTGAYDLRLTSAMTKQIDAAWADGDAAGGLFSGTVAADTWYHRHLIRKDSDGSIDWGWDVSVTAANIPLGYTAYSHIGTDITDSSSNIAASFEVNAYKSTEQTITSGGLLTLEHGLGAEPDVISYRLICKTAEHNYSIGNVIDIAPMNQSGSGTDRLNAVHIDSTNINIRYSSISNCFSGADKSTGSVVVLTNANWKLIVKAWVM